VSIVSLEDAGDPARYGGKAFHLGAALRAGLPVPPGYAVSVEALYEVEQGHAALRAQAGALVDKLGPPVAVRSSAVGEDAEEASFAGQHLTCLNVLDAEAVIAGLLRVYESAHCEAALAYREKRGISAAVSIGAVVQKLVDPVCAGVLFTRNPVTGANERVIEAAWGLGETVVAGLVTPDYYRVTRDGRVIETRIGEKDLAVRRNPLGSTSEVEVEAKLVHAPCLDMQALVRLHELAQRCETHFGSALDLEWAFADDVLYLLQSRPISTGRA
jgi:pyruvate,water dikinase